MRRALRNIRMVGMEEPFLYKMTGFVAELMQGPYPEMVESVQRVARVVKDEEHRYATTFLVAERVFNEAIKNIEGKGIPGALSFKLYDTYGLALDEQEEMAREHGLALDRAAFDSEMEQQRERARASWKGAEKGAVTAGRVRRERSVGVLRWSRLRREHRPAPPPSRRPGAADLGRNDERALPGPPARGGEGGWARTPGRRSRPGSSRRHASSTGRGGRPGPGCGAPRGKLARGPDGYGGSRRRGPP